MPGWASPTGEAMPQRSESGAPVSGDRVVRFDASERWTHRIFGVLVGLCLVTAAFLSIPDLSVLVGQRDMLRLVHLGSGFLMPVPLIVGYATSARFRSDVSRLNRFTPDDWRWLRPSRRVDDMAIGKFNAGQKLNAAFTLGSTLVMLATGAVLTFSSLFSDRTRTGSTFVHDWLALAIAIVVLGHMWKAANDAGARLGMRSGYVSAQWARDHHPQWADEMGLGVPTSAPTDPEVGEARAADR